MRWSAHTWQKDSKKTRIQGGARSWEFQDPVALPPLVSLERLVFSSNSCYSPGQGPPAELGCGELACDESAKSRPFSVKKNVLR